MPATFCEQLTPAERELLRLLLDGLRVCEAAQQTGKAVSTARTHVKHLHQKTGTHSLRDLVAWGSCHTRCCIA